MMSLRPACQLVLCFIYQRTEHIQVTRNAQALKFVP